MGFTERQRRRGDGWELTPSACLGSQDLCGLHPPWRLHQVLAQHSGSQPARLLVGLLPVFIGPSATSEVLPLQRQEGPGEGSVPSEHQMGYTALNRQWPQGEKKHPGRAIPTEQAELVGLPFLSCSSNCGRMGSWLKSGRWPPPF